MTIRLTHSNPYVNLQCTESKRPLKLLVDSGAHISIILAKPNLINPGTKINHNEIMNIRGVGKGKELLTKGYSLLNLLLPFSNLQHKFHILDDVDHNIPYDGILGGDFFTENKAVIDYKEKVFKTGRNSVPLFLTVNEHSQERKSNDIFMLAARTEQLIEINVLNPEIKEGVIPELSLPKGLLVSRAITKVNSNSKAFATILNPTDSPVPYDEIRVKLEPLPKQSYLFAIQEMYNPSHSKMVLDNIRDDHLNPEEKTSLHKIITEYDDIFHIEGYQ